MNSSEKQRKQLLESTRALYREDRIPPAIHPRYGTVYGELYGREEEPGSLGLRTALCCILFAVFVILDFQDGQIAEVTPKMAVEMVETDAKLVEVWSQAISDSIESVNK